VIDNHRDLARLLPDPAPHDLPRVRHLTLREQFMAQIIQPDVDAPPATGPSTPDAVTPDAVTPDAVTPDAVRPDAVRPAAVPAWRRRRRVLIPAVAASLVVLLLAAYVTSAVTLGVGKLWAGDSGAGSLLGQIALAAANSTDLPPADQIRDDQFVYVETWGGFSLGTASTTSRGSITWAAPQPHQRQIWLSVDGTRTGLLRDSWNFPGTAGGPQTSSLAPNQQPSVNDPTFRYLTTLPTNPDQLLALIYWQTWGSGPNPQQEAFITIGDLLRESIVPPQLAQALYRAAARIPGVTTIDDAVDARGRHGLAIARTGGGEQDEWIFDHNTLQFLGERQVATESGMFGPAGTLIGTTAVVGRGVVNHPGDLPD
jgi:hypothetical protein